MGILSEATIIGRIRSKWAIQATGLAAPNDLEAAILATVTAGCYTAILSGNGGGTGIGLVEVYKAEIAARLPCCSGALLPAWAWCEATRSDKVFSLEQNQNKVAVR